MHLFLLILLFSFLSGVLSLVGGVILLARVSWVREYSVNFVSFAVGALLATAFLDLLPEALAVGEGKISILMISILSGILGFFILESLILKFHHYHVEEANEHHHHATPTLLMIGDTVHNFIDGLALATAFLGSVPLGIVTALAIAAHEFPQEISDFSVMLHHGWARKKVLFMNLFSSFASILGAIIAFLARDLIEPVLPQLLGVTAGIFVYIATADLIPEISPHHAIARNKSTQVFTFLVLGVLAVWVLKFYLE